jgi:hypothetical protein
METTPLSYRMYFFVPYNLSPIQQAIQAGHCVEEYGDKYRDTPLYKEYRLHKTWIILNGGTTSDMIDVNGCYYGSLNQLEVELLHAEIPYAKFREPDLNNALTALCFIVDERVFDKIKYPDYLDWYQARCIDFFEKNEKFNPEQWEELIGGKKNIFLREFLKGKKLA